MICGGCAEGQLCAEGGCVTGQATYPFAADICNGFPRGCAGNPACEGHTRLQGGTRGARFSGAGGCDQCITDADCRALSFPPGSTCIQDAGPLCGACVVDGRGFCAEPCSP